MVIQNLYQIFKFTSSFITKNEYNIKNYSVQTAYKDENIVSIGDNILFQQLRRLNHNEKSTEEIFSNVQKLYKLRKECKKQGEYKKAGIYTKLISKTLFVPEVVNVLVERKSDFIAFSEKGFYVNNEHFTRFLCGSGQMRRNTITFVRDDVWHPLRDILSCELENNRAKEFNLAKYDAYFALSFSSVLWVRRPRVCVIKDFFNQIQDQNVDWIEPDEITGKKHIVKRVMNIELNCADGQGLIDPEFSKLWADDMHLSFVPCSFVIRSCFVKGNLVPFDFKEYARENNISTIKDRWGKEYNIEDVDVLLSESQFKTHKYYNSWDEYWQHIEKYDIKWGVARYNKKFDDENVLANYQYLQTLELSKDDIKDLIRPTEKWIKQVCSGDTLYSLLYMYGKKQGDANYQDMYSSAQSLATKAVVKNVDMLKDSYVQRKIYRNIVENINKAKIGKIWIKGNYQFMISDPMAQCQSALGLKPLGEIPADHVYSNFWNERRIEGYVDCCRSPMIDQHEHNPSKLYNSEKASKWYKYIYSGIIYSIYDTSTARHEDSDLTK